MKPNRAPLHFGITDSFQGFRTYVDTPVDILDTLFRQSSVSGDALRRLKSIRLGEYRSETPISIHRDGSYRRLYFNHNKIGNKATSSQKRMILKGLSAIITGLHHAAGPDRSDPKFIVTKMTQNARIDDQTIQMKVRLSLPDTSDTLVKGHVKQMMDLAASRLRGDSNEPPFGSEVLMTRDVGVMLGVDQRAFLSTASTNFIGDPEKCELASSGIRSHAEQMVLFTGAVALAHADDLLETS